MRFRFPAVLLAAALCVLPALGDKRKAENSAETGPQPSEPALQVVQAQHVEPGVAKPSGPDRLDSDPNYRMNQLLNESEDLRQAREDMHHFWMNHQPQVLTYERLDGPDVKLLEVKVPGPAPVGPPVAQAAPQAPAGMTLPSGQYLQGNWPQYFPEEPDFPLSRELAYSEETVGLLTSADRFVVKSYTVGDLVIPPPPVGAKMCQTVKTCERELIEKIMTAVAPKSWQKYGGMGTIEYFPIGMALVVNQTPAVHAALDKFLDTTRKIQDSQFQIRVTVATVPEGALEKLGLAHDFGSAPDKPGAIHARVKYLSSEAVAKLDLKAVGLIDACMPTLTVLNGQEGSVRMGETAHFMSGVTVEAVNGNVVFTPKNEPHDLGVTVKVKPTISADSRFIQLNVLATASDLAVRPVAMIPLSTPIRPAFADGKFAQPTPFTQFIQDPRIVTRTVDETIVLPDGCTAVFYGGPATIEETVKKPMPTLADVPFFADLFAQEKKVSATNHLLVFVTPSVVKPDEIERCAACCKADAKLTKLLGDYSKACQSGRVDDARRLAVECLAIDPMCFAKK